MYTSGVSKDSIKKVKENTNTYLTNLYPEYIKKFLLLNDKKTINTIF